MDKVLEQVSKFEITDKTIICISGDMSMERKHSLQHQIEAATGIRPPVVLTGDGDLTTIDIKNNTLLILKSEYPWCGEPAMGKMLREAFQSTTGHNVPILNLVDGDDLSQLETDDILTLRDTIHEILSGRGK